MSDTDRRIAQVLASMAIIIVIAVLRDRSRTLAAITATMPVNVALGLWIVADRAEPPVVVSFARSMLAGVAATLVWVLAVWLGARAGWGLGRLLLAGYAAWAVVLGAAALGASLLGVGPVFPW